MNPPTTPPANSEAVQAAIALSETDALVRTYYADANDRYPSELGFVPSAEYRLLTSLAKEVRRLQAALAEAKKRIVELEAKYITRLEDHYLVLKEAKLHFEEAEAENASLRAQLEAQSSESARYRTALEQIADPDCTDYDCPQCGRIVSKHPTGECPSCGFLSQGQIKAALATPGDGANKSVDGPSGRLLVACLEEGYDVKKTSRGFEAMKT